jgi:hypothetical protein
MLKLNLLPPYINQKKQVRMAVAVVTALVIAEVALMIWARTGPAATLAAKQTEFQQVQSEYRDMEPLGQQSSAILAEEADILPKYDFMTKMLEYNEAYPDLYQTTAGYTYREVMFMNLEASTNQLQFNAYVSNPRDVSRLMYGLSRCPEFVGLPQISNVPGWNSAEAAARQAAQNQEMVPGTDIIGASGFGGGGVAFGGGPGTFGGGAPPGFGPMMGMGGGGGNGPGGGGGFTGGGVPPGFGALAGGGGAMMSGAMVDGGGGNGPGGGFGGGSAFAGGGGSGGGGLDALNLAGATRAPRGFNVTVSCQLRNPIVRPSNAAADGQLGGGGGGFGGMGGAMGAPPGFSGMMMGGMGGGGNGPMAAGVSSAGGNGP